jgi:hypothetical protein
MRASQEMNTDPSMIGIEEFDVGYLAWRLPPPREDPARPPETIGGAYLVVDKDTGDTSIWPLLDPVLIMHQFRRAKHGHQVDWEYGSGQASHTDSIRTVTSEPSPLVTVTYEQARELVLEHFAPGWTNGTFCLDDRLICENDEFYVFNIGAREFIIAGDSSYATAGSVPIVFKEDGRLESRPSAMVATDPSIRSTPNPNPTMV